MLVTFSLMVVLVHLAQLEAVGHVVEDVVVRQQGVALEHHGGVALVGGELVDGLAAQVDLALVRALEAGDHAQDRGLAAAGGAQQAHELARGDVDVGVVHGVEVLARLGILVDLGDVVDLHAFLLFSHRLVLLLGFAGAEVLDEDVHAEHGGVGDKDQDGRERAGHGVLAAVGVLVDLHRDEQVLRA